MGVLYPESAISLPSLRAISLPAISLPLRRLPSSPLGSFLAGKRDKNAKRDKKFVCLLSDLARLNRSLGEMRNNKVKQNCLVHMRNRSRTLRNEPTEAEKKLWEALRYDRCDGLRFLRQHVIGVYIVDFYCAKAKLVVEVDGSIHDLPEVQQQDRRRQQLIEEHGLHVLRMTNDDVRAKNSDQLRESIRDFLTALRT